MQSGGSEDEEYVRALSHPFFERVAQQVLRSRRVHLVEDLGESLDGGGRERVLDQQPALLGELPALRLAAPAAQKGLPVQPAGGEVGRGVAGVVARGPS